MRKWIVIFFLFVVALGLASPTRADRLDELNRQIEEYQRELTRLVGEANTLKNQIASFDAQINLTTVRINQTEEQVKLLTDRIGQLEVSLSSLGEAFVSRAVETYKMSRFNEAVVFVASSDDLSEAFSRIYYLRKIQEADRNLIGRLSGAKDTYNVQKDKLEELKVQLEQQSKVLGAQKAAKANLLEVTRNDEKRYQELLARAKAEIEAIQAIIAGKGEETEVGKIGEGQRIASVIPGVSACSSGTHLHFEVVQNEAHTNPASFLVPKVVIWDNAPDGQFDFTGGWQWPINDPVRITQGYGMTYYAANLRYYGGLPHTGLDMVNNDGDLTVKAVKPGTLYRGAIGCGGGTLRYVHVDQDDGYDTYYLHVNY